MSVLFCYTSMARETFLIHAVSVYKTPCLLNATDDMTREATFCSCNITMDDTAWKQAPLLVRLSGTGVRRLADTAVPAFIVSMGVTKELTRLINHRGKNDRPATLASANEAFTEKQWTVFDHNEAISQRRLEALTSRLRYEHPLSQSNQIDRTCLLETTSPNSGTWLSTLPVERLGFLLSDEECRIGVGLRMGTPVHQSQRCHYGTTTDSVGHHNLSYHRDQSRLPRHSVMNDPVPLPFLRRPHCGNGTLRIEPRRRSSTRRSHPLTIQTRADAALGSCLH